MNYIEIEKKWQKKWADTNIYKFDENNLDKKYYCLEMFSYPSAAKLHLGHWWNYGLTDSFARFKRMQGYNVFHPMGFDAFGLPAENFAIKNGIHPSDSTHKNIEIMERQLKEMGATFNWEYEIKTCEPDYYKWTQWVFLKLYEKGLAYQKFAPVNWCPSCKTVLANEQVINGGCERCGSEVVKKELTQWFFKITDYCEKLLEGLDRLDWPNKTKISQRNWIGKSKGANIEFATESGEKICVFTSRPDTLAGVTWVVLAPEHKLVKELTTEEQKEEVEKYIYEASKKDEITRTSTATEKTGVFLGSYVINPLNGAKVPVYIGDYVLASYGTGAVMGVAAHDERDYDFAKKYNLPIIQVIENPNGETILPYTENGKLVNSGKYNGLTSEEAKKAIVNDLKEKGAGDFKTNYKLRDWSVSRQRYWGCPIPVIHCDHCGVVPVPEKDLPVKLPYDVDWTPDGRSPLAKNEEYMNCTCPKCGKPARRDPDTLDTFICSSWYQLRYPNAKREDVAFDKEFTNKILPVDKYVGGMEHANGHLLYSRFITKVLHDAGYLSFDEPFTSLVHQGILLGPDGFRMSKSRGNTISPDDYISVYGTDTFRLYLMFGFNYMEGGPWKEEGIKATVRFVERLERLLDKVNSYENANDVYGEAEAELDYALNYAIKEIRKDFEVFGFNTVVARIMELVNAMYKYDQNENKNTTFFKEVAKKLILLIAPCMPHFAEEMWEEYGMPYSIFNERYPEFDESKLVTQKVEIAVQVNSKIVARVDINPNAEQKEILSQIKSTETVAKLIEGKTIVKEIYVPGRICNFIVK